MKVRSKIVQTIVFVLASVYAIAQTKTATWEPHPEAAGLTGFELWESTTSGTFPSIPKQTILGGNSIQTTIDKPGIGRWYYVLTAHVMEDDGTVIRSDPSNEAYADWKPVPPTFTSPVIASKDLTDKKTIHFTWKTDRSSNSAVQYNRIGFLPKTVSDASYVINHFLTASGLQPNQNWFFIAESCNGDGCDQSTGSFSTR